MHRNLIQHAPYHRLSVSPTRVVLHQAAQARALRVTAEPARPLPLGTNEPFH